MSDRSNGSRAKRRRNAERGGADQSLAARRGSGAFLTLALGLGVVLGGIATTLALKLDATAPTTRSAAIVAMANLVAPPPPGTMGLAEQTSGAAPAPIASGIATPMAETTAVMKVQGGQHENLPTPMTLRIEDCVTRLDRYLAQLFIQFELGSAVITPESAALLARISDRIILCEDAYVMVAGHADGSGSDLTNLTLSWERADQTLNRLVQLGVDPAAVEAVGFGARAPLAHGSADENGADRRVDFRVLRIRDGQH